MVAVGLGRTQGANPPSGRCTAPGRRRDTRPAMRGEQHHTMRLVDRPAFESYLKLLAVVGMSGLGLWLVVAAIGLVTGVASVDPSAVFPFLVSVLVLVVPSVVYPELRRWPYRHLSAAARLGLEDRDD
jgi:hypothetical protein